MRRAHDIEDPEAGTVAVMILGFLTLIVLVVALVVDSSSYFLTRRDAQAFCDRLALASAREQSVGYVLDGGARDDGRGQPLMTSGREGHDSPEIDAALAGRRDIWAGHGTVQGQPAYSDDDGRPSVAGGPAPTRVTWTCQEHAQPPFTGAFHDDGYPVVATSSAKTSTATAGG